MSCCLCFKDQVHFVTLDNFYPGFKGVKMVLLIIKFVDPKTNTMASAVSR